MKARAANLFLEASHTNSRVLTAGLVPSPSFPTYSNVVRPTNPVRRFAGWQRSFILMRAGLKLTHLGSGFSGSTVDDLNASLVEIVSGDPFEQRGGQAFDTLGAHHGMPLARLHGAGDPQKTLLRERSGDVIVSRAVFKTIERPLPEVDGDLRAAWV